MKDEEMAEEFVNEKCKDCYMCSYSEYKNPYKKCQRRKDRKQAFLAGYKAGFKDCSKARLNTTTISDCPIKYEWHDLRKNPRDLPTEDCKDYLAIALDDTEPGVFMYIASEQGQWEWEPRRIAFYTNDQIKAWCEIPTFEEAEGNDKRSS